MFFLFSYWLLVNFLVLHSPFSYFDNLPVPALEHFEVVAGDEEGPEFLKQHAWQHQALPDDWYKTGKTHNQYWYKSHLLLDHPVNDIWAVYLPTVTHAAAVFINGTWVGQSGYFSDPVSRHHNDPLLFSFSGSMLKKGQNDIHIRVKASYHEQGLLGQVYVAPFNQLNKYYEIKHFVRIDLIQWLTSAMYLMALVVLVFWMARPQDKIYGLFSLELIFWATHNLNLIITDIPVSARLWESLMMSTLGWTVLTMIYFNHRFVGEVHPRIEKLALTAAALGLGLFFLPDLAAVLHVGYRVWDALLIVVGLYLIGYLGRVFWKNPQSDYFLMLLVGIPMLIFGLHDILVVNHMADRTDGLIIQFSVIPALLLFSWFMVRRFVKSINKAEHLAEHFEQLVDEKTREIEFQYDKLKEMEKQSVLAEERERIMRDMHDGIGGQLVSVISLLQDQKGDVFKRLREKVQHSLTDLRLVIDSLDPVQNELPVLLGTMRMRLHDQLDAANIHLEWAVTDLPDIPDTSPRRSLHIMRIVQEAITNCIKHADTEKIRLVTGTLGEQESHVYIDIIDYGKGLKCVDENAENQGRGIKNMHYRAEQMGAKLDLDSSEEGTRIRLLIALESA